MTSPLSVSFVAGRTGRWRIDDLRLCRGEGMPAADRMDMREGSQSPGARDGVWQLDGFTSELRYTTGSERKGLVAVQAPLGRSEAVCAALIPIRKNAAWWEMAQDERRAIFEECSHHIAIGRDYLPAVARRLHHCRGRGGPFDFLTWFEYAPEAESAFDAMLTRLRDTEEWCYVEREVDIRLVREK
jgi:hypothetical protein